MESNIVNKYNNLSLNDKNIYKNRILNTLRNDISLDIIIETRTNYNSLLPIINDTAVYTCQQIFGVPIENKKQVLLNTINKINNLLQ
jgi:hypothetical protein